MKVTCQSCQAKYTIADEKVRGKVAKIRCKKCGTTIIVNGTDVAAGAVVTSGASTGSTDDQWSVLVADGDQRTVTLAQLVDLFSSGAINSETPAWKDGMVDWLPIGQIDALRALVQHGAAVSMLPDASSPYASHLPDVSNAGAPPAFPTAEAVAARAPAARLNMPEPAARRRGRAGSTDLFGAAVQDDVMTSAAVDPVPHAPSGGNDRMTGARNENSVLFSLASLTGGGGGGSTAAQKPAPSVDRDPISSKADLRSLMGGGESKAPQKSKLDDIINLSGGGVYSPAMLTAPALAPPPVELSSAADTIGDPVKPRSKGLVTLVVVGAVAIAGAAFAFTMNNKAEADKAMAAASASAKAASEALAVALAAAEAKSGSSDTIAAASADSPPSAPTVLAPGQSAPKPEAEKKTVVAKADKSVDKEKPAAPGSPPPAAALGVPPPAPAAPKEPAPAAGGGGDFDRASALSALSAAATAAQSCKKADGPTGSGRISVTFANNGQATTANVDGPPFAGTPVGGCVAARFRGTHVPPFGGAPVTVHKTFNIN